MNSRHKTKTLQYLKNAESLWKKSAMSRFVKWSSSDAISQQRMLILFLSLQNQSGFFKEVEPIERFLLKKNWLMQLWLWQIQNLQGGSAGWRIRKSTCCSSNPKAIDWQNSCLTQGNQSCFIQASNWLGKADHTREINLLYSSPLI